MSSALAALLTERLAAPVPAAVRGFAAALAAEWPGTQAVLFYGSSLRTGDLTGTLLDFYVLTPSAPLAARLLPPNVYYREWTGPDATRYRAKVAVMTLGSFTARCAAGSLDVSIWARFAQPCALVWGDAPVAAALAQAVETAAASVPSARDPRDWWSAVFARTYRCELRAERGNKPGEIVDLFADYYAEITPLLRAGPGKSQGWWAARRWFGRIQHVARLLKAAFTFSGGIDYLAWKISRHSGVPVVIKDWHRRWPLIAGPWLAIKLKRQGAIR
jgi:hypothetical protein